MQKKKHALGFTLIELLIALAIIGLITSLSLPSYFSYILKTKRTEAYTTLLNTQLYLERYYVDNSSYPTTLPTDYQTSDNNYYAISLSNPSGTQSYLITATAQNTQAKDTDCIYFTLSHTGLKAAYDAKRNANLTCWGP